MADFVALHDLKVLRQLKNPLVQIQILRTVNHFVRLILRSRITRKLRGAANVTSTRMPIANAITTGNLNARLLVPVPSLPLVATTELASSRGRNQERCVKHFTLARK